tara:strand:+ start:2782 stop:2901 length:120 start_codon:yes stop_codon:yes gene_type:complete
MEKNKDCCHGSGVYSGNDGIQRCRTCDAMIAEKDEDEFF